MHDFCFTPMYSVLLLFGGFIGYIGAGSSASLMAGGGAAALTGLCAYVSMKFYLKRHKKCLTAVVLSLMVAAAITAKMGQAFLADPSTHVPQGFLFLSSATMCLYYVWNLAVFKPKPPAKGTKAK